LPVGAAGDGPVDDGDVIVRSIVKNLRGNHFGNALGNATHKVFFFGFNENDNS
jgi:hypothetical protein